MGRIRVGNLASDIANTGGAFLKGAREERESKEAKALRERMAELEERKVDLEGERNEQGAKSDAERLRLMGEDSKRNAEQLELARRGDERAATEASRRQATEDENKTKDVERRAGLRSRLQSLVPNLGKDTYGMSAEDMERQIEIEQNRRARLQEIEAQGKYDQSRQLQQIRTMQQMANTAMLTAKRNFDDAQEKIFSDRALIQQYNELTKQKVPNALAIMVQKVSGKDFYADYLNAAAQIQQYNQMAASLGGIGGGPSPGVTKAVDRNMPYAYQTPEAQASIMAEVTKQLQSGTPLNVKSLNTMGVPFADIAKNMGMAVDPMTGMVSKPQAAQVEAPSATPAGMVPGSLPDMLRAQQAPGAAAGTMPTMPAPTAPVPGSLPDMLRAQTQPGAAAAPAASTQAAPQATFKVPSSSFHRDYGVPSFPGHTLPAPPAPNADSAANAQDAQRSVSMYRLMLSRSADLPNAEQSARALLDLGEDYNMVITSAPQQFQSLLAAKLPKRIPTQPKMAAPLPSANPFTPPGSAPTQPGARPMFTPPSY